MMDNLCARKTQKARELVEGAGCNPIEEAFSKIEGILRKAEVRARKSLVEALGLALSAMSEEDARGFFEHCGYVTLVQSL